MIGAGGSAIPIAVMQQLRSKLFDLAPTLWTALFAPAP